MSAAMQRAPMRDGLRALHRRRRAQRLRNLDWVDALYRAYVVGISLVAALVMIAFVVGDAPVGHSTLSAVRDHGPAIAGAFVAFVIAIGLRSGSHGGPLAFEAADVQHVFLAPVDRGLVVRASAYRQLRGVLSTGVLAGAIAGIAAAPRLPGPGRGTAAWLAAGVAFGLAAALAAWGSALVAAALRMNQLVALLIGGGLIGWSALDLVVETRISPCSWLGHVAVWPLTSSWLVVPGFAVAIAIVAFGLASARRLSLEPVLHRAQLVRSLKFAATMQDVRAVITLRRQLTHEQSRTRPWIRVRPGPPTGHASWRRDWHGVARWPGARFTRVLVLTLVVGASSAAAIRGTTPLFAVGAIAAYVIALDTVEGLAQEVDHPDRGAGVPLPSGDLYVAHLAAPVVLVVILGVVGLGAGIFAGSMIPVAHHVHRVSPVVGIAVVLALAATAPMAGALSVYLSRPDRDLSVAMLNPRLVTAQQFAPLIVVALAFLPLVVAREVEPPTDPVRAAFASTAPALMIAFGIFTFLRARRTDIG